MKNNKINSFALCSIIFSICTSTFYGIFSSYVLNTAKTDTLFSMIIGYIISLIISTIILKLFNTNESKRIEEKLSLAYKKISIIPNIIILVCSLFIYIFIAYRLTSFISNQYLTTLNKSYIYLLIIFITYNTASKGIETTTRLTTISIYICLAIYLFIFFGLLGKINFENYLPLITESTKNILKSSLVFSLYFSAPVFYINIVKKDDLVDKEKFNKSFYKMHFFTFLIVFFAIMSTLGVYGINLSNLFDYPVYTVLNKIKISTFIDSVENVLVIFWLLCGINGASVTLLYILGSVKNTFNINKTNKISDYIILILLFLFPTLFYKNNNYFESFNYLIFPLIVSSVLISFVILTLTILKIKNKLKNNS